MSLTAGVYGSDTLGLTGTLTLDAEGDPAAVFIFQAASTLITAPDSSVALINGASACNVYWQIGSSATLDTSTSFKGTILALTSIGLNTGATLEGRALAPNGEVTLDANVIDSSACAAPTGPAATVPATDALRSTPAAVTDPAPAVAFVFLVVGAVAFLAAIRLVAPRSRPRA